MLKILEIFLNLWWILSEVPEFWPNSDLDSSNGSVPCLSNLSTKVFPDSTGYESPAMQGVQPFIFGEANESLHESGSWIYLGQKAESIIPRYFHGLAGIFSNIFGASDDVVTLTSDVQRAVGNLLQSTQEIVPWVANKSFEISKFKFNISESSNLRTSQGSFSAVSKPNFASKYSLESSLRDLHNALLCTVL